MAEPAVKVDDLNKTFFVPERDAGLRAAAKSLFRRRHREVRAVDDITFEIAVQMLADKRAKGPAPKRTTTRKTTTTRKAPAKK